jgi:para-nitrobenzyl esterase
VKSLEWVRGNIKAFGGDPKNVTIAGESGGAFNVLSLLISPLAKGLFHHAVIESGLSLIWSPDTAMEQSSKLIVALLMKDGAAKSEKEAWHVLNNMRDEDINAYLRSKSAFTITKNIPTREFGMAEWRTIFTDGVVIPEEGYEIFSSGEWANKVPVIIGCTKDEMKLFGWFRKNPPLNTREYDLVWKYHSMLWRANGVDEVVSKMTSHRAVPVYVYRFDWGSMDKNGNSVLPKNKGRDLGAHHAAEIPFFLGMGEADLATLIGSTHTKKNQPGREKLTDLCMKYLANFARMGNPNNGELPVWPIWDNLNDLDRVIVLDAGLNDLRISYLKERITTQDVIELVNSELQEPERGYVVNMLDGFIPLRNNTD